MKSDRRTKCGGTRRKPGKSARARPPPEAYGGMTVRVDGREEASCRLYLDF